MEPLVWCVSVPCREHPGRLQIFSLQWQSDLFCRKYRYQYSAGEKGSSADNPDTTAENEANKEQTDSSGSDPGNRPRNGQQPGQTGGGMEDEDQGATLTINGGNIYVNANGDGLDANGDILNTGGNITLHGPADGGNGGNT